VAESAEAEVDVRVGSAADGAAVDRAIRSLTVSDSRLSVSVEGGIDRPPLERNAAVLNLYGQARAVAAGLGRDLGEGSTGGGSDGNFTAAAGVPTLDGMGAVGGRAHAVGEYVEIAQIPWRSALLAGVLRRMSGRDTG
jgi:glutamate carboxypeptidase